VTLDQAGPVLARHAERMYRWISDAGIVVPEVLLVPLYLGGQDPLGTLWIVSDEDGHFDRDHARVATELAAFVGIALRMEQTEQRLRQALEEQKTMTQEMGHRIKNLFAVVEGMVRFSARGAGSKDEMAQVLSGRLQALASGYALAGRGRDDGDDVGASSLEEILRAIIEPHEGIGTGATRRFALRGPHVLCDGRAVNGLALALHELATNAIKYGALSTETGHVAIAWRRAGEELVLQWTERGGPTVAGPPTQEGFGGRLIDSAVVHQLGGAVEYDWQADGLVVTIRASASNLKV
jgi:two-component sensor histidine kinase